MKLIIYRYGKMDDEVDQVVDDPVIIPTKGSYIVMADGGRQEAEVTRVVYDYFDGEIHVFTSRPL